MFRASASERVGYSKIQENGLAIETFFCLTKKESPLLYLDSGYPNYGGGY